MSGFPVDVGDAGVVLIVSVRAFFPGARNGIIIEDLAGRFVASAIVLLTGKVNNGLAAVPVDILGEYVLDVMAANTALRFDVLQAGVWGGTTIGSDTTLLARVGMAVVVLIKV